MRKLESKSKVSDLIITEIQWIQQQRNPISTFLELW